MDNNFQKNIEPIDKREERWNKLVDWYNKTLFWNVPKPIFSDNDNNNLETTTDPPESL